LVPERSWSTMCLRCLSRYNSVNEHNESERSAFGNDVNDMNRKLSIITIRIILTIIQKLQLLKKLAIGLHLHALYRSVMTMNRFCWCQSMKHTNSSSSSIVRGIT
jgi:hypothetical protein